MQQSWKGGVGEADVCCEIAFPPPKDGIVTIICWWCDLVLMDAPDLNLCSCRCRHACLCTVHATRLPAVALLLLVVVAGAHP